MVRRCEHVLKPWLQLELTRLICGPAEAHSELRGGLASILAQVLRWGCRWARRLQRRCGRHGHLRSWQRSWQAQLALGACICAVAAAECCSYEC